MKICVLNASNPNTISLESDIHVDYRDGRQSCFLGDKRVKQCTSWHSWPYALESEFFVYGKDKWQDCFKYDGVVLLVNRDIESLIPLVKKLKLMKKKVAISFHEGAQDLLGGSGVPGEDVVRRWVGLSEMVKECDFYINIFGQLNEFYQGWFGKDKVKFVNHGAPFDWNHGYYKTFEQKKYDILCGTRTFNQRLSRNTLIQLGIMNGLAEEKGYNVHFLSEDGNVKPLLDKIGMNNIQVHQGPLKWEEWLEFLSQFKVVTHFDSSLNLSQIVFDAIMVGTICVGSTGWNNAGCYNTGDYSDSRINSEKILFNLNAKEPWKDMMVFNFKKQRHPDQIKIDLLKVFNAL